jgi:type 1 glutamine amidotransferase
VAWTVQRKDGGRGFSTTMGHYFSNWQLPYYRKFLLNGIVWAAGAKVPKNGVEASFYTDEEVTAHLYKKKKKALI